ncbi:Ig-like domain-containing protein [Pseudoalteromonas sp. SSM20]|uniref:Ig-like domain-containing protein n=1 Tax=Pseudoalteromonas sp. SSM20 TaxID=3139394 RepID=UPI003BA8E315
MKLLKTQFVTSFLLLLLMVMPLSAKAAASLGVAKKADATGRDISFVITIENLGDEVLSDLTLTDDLDAAFGAGNYSITSMPNLVSGSGITFNAAYDGSGDVQVIDSGSLAVGELVKIGFGVSIDTPVDLGSGLGIYSNQASVTANSGSVTDVSDWGDDPDPNGNGDATESGENDPTEVSIFDNPIVGVSLTAAVSGTQVTFDYFIENLGNATLSELTLTNDLDNVFGAGNYTVISAPSFIQNSGAITLNSVFDGSANQNIINTSSSLNIGALSQIRLVVDVTTTIDKGMGDGVYAIQAQAQGQSYYGKVSTDLSSNSNEPSQSINENTVFTIGESAVIGVALTSSVTGNTVTYDYYLENLGNVDLQDLDLVNNLNTVFGAGNYYISQTPSFIDNPGSITLNENFDGNFNTNLISVGTLATADTAQIRIDVELLAISDQGSGEGIYQNQASISAQSSGGALTNDLSDSGTDPDPNGNGDPTESGENDVTQSIITEETLIGISLDYGISVVGGLNYIDLIYTVENHGNTTVSNITIQSNLNNVFGAGNYSHVLDPSEVSGAGTFNFNAAYNGNTNTALLNAGSTLAPSEKVIFKTQSRIVTLSDQGNGLGVYQHQVTLNATGPDVNPVSDVSVSGDTPDENGNGDPTDDASVTTIDTNISRQVGLAIDVAVVGNQVTLDYYIENFGNADASGFSLTNSLDTIFGAGNYTFNSFNLIDDPTTLDLNAAFDGSFDHEMLDTSGSLAAGDTAQLQVVVTINKVVNVGLGLGNYSTQLTLNALNVNSPVSDLSDFGTDADPNGNSDPTEAGENDATTFTLGGLGLVGAALDVTTTANQATFDIYLENFTADSALNLALPVDLDAIFGSGNYNINQLVFISDPGTITLNNGSFDGTNDTALISANSSLAGNATAQIRLVVDITNKADNFDLGVGAYQAQFEISTTSASNITTSDLTDSSTDPDDNANGDPSDVGEDDLTSFTVGDTGVVGVAMRAEVSGTTVTYTLKVENFSDTTINNISIKKPLNGVFGSGNYSVLTQPSYISGEQTLSLSPQFFGFNVFDSLVLGGSLAPNSYSEFKFSVSVNTVTDQGNGFGVYHSQVTVNASDINGTAISDASDDGFDPDPNGNNSPGDTGEDDQTIAIIGDEANIGISTTASAVGNLVTFDYYIENFGGSTLDSFAFEQDLDSVFGAGNYSIDTALAFVDDPGTLTLNGGFDGSGDKSIITTGNLLTTDTAQIRLVVSVDTLSDVGNGFGSYSNQVSISAQAPLGSPTEDVSDDGVDPDPDGDGNPRGTNESDVTSFVISNAVIGSALDIKVEAGIATLEYYLENLGNGVSIDELSLVHSLDALFGSGNYSIISGPVIVGEQRNVVVNEAYDGSGNTELLDTASSIAAGETHQIQVVASINNVINNGTYTTSVTVNGRDPLDAPISDTSDMGTDPDSDGNKIADEAGNNDPTTFGVPLITSTNLSALGATGNSGIYIVGDTLIATWDNTASGDNNALTVQSVVFDFSAFGGSNVVPAINSGDKWQASMTIVEDGGGVIEQGGLNFSALVTLNTGDSNQLSSVVNLSIDNNSPVISGVSIPNQTFKVGDSIPVSISITDLSANLISGLVNSVSVTNFMSLGAGSYSADYLVQEGDNDVIALNDVPVFFSVTDNAGNASATYTTAISQNADNIDANTPTGHSIIFDSTVNLTNQNSAALSFANVEVGTSYSITVSSSGGATTEVVTGSVSSSSQQVSGIDLSNVDDGTLTASAIITDSAGNIATPVTNTIIKDTSAPTVDISIPTVDQNSAFLATITFSESVTGFVESDITVANATLSGFSGSGASYIVTVTPDSDGVVTLDVAAASAQDVNGNDNSAASQVSVKYDATAPTTTITFPSVTQIAAFTATIEFSEAVTGFTQSDISVVNATLSGFAGTGGSYSVTVTPTSNGSVTMNVAGGIAQDSAGNNNTAASEVSVEFDGTSPTTTIVVPSAPQNSSFTATITFGESVTGFIQSDIIASNATLSNFAGSGNTYTVTVMPTIDGLVTLNVGAGVAQDSSGNSNTAAQAASVEFDGTLPTVELTTPSTIVNSDFEVVITFNEDVTGLTTSEFDVTNGNIKSLQVLTASSYKVLVHPLVKGEVSVVLKAGSVRDGAGNTNLASNKVTVEYNSDTVSVTIDAPSKANNKFEVSISFNDNVSGFDISDIQAENATLSNFLKISSTNYTVDVAGNSLGKIQLSIPENVVLDDYGNGNNASQLVEVEFDNIKPQVTSLEPQKLREDVSVETDFSITFDESIELGSGTISLKNTNDNSLVMATRYEVLNNKLIFEFTDFLKVNTKYQLIVEEGVVVDLFGNNSGQVFDWFFTVGNSAPIAVNDSGLTKEDTALLIDIVANDKDVDSELDLSSIEISSAVNGVVTIKDNGVVEYLPNSDYYGSDSFTYTIADASGARSNQAVVSIEITSVNDAPVFTSTPQLNASVFSTYKYEVEVSDIDSEELSVSLIKSPDWLVLNEQVLEGNVPLSALDQSFDILLEVSDGDLIKQQEFTLSVVDFDESSISITQGVNVSPILIKEIFELKVLVSNSSKQNVLVDQMLVKISGAEVLSLPNECSENADGYLCKVGSNLGAEKSFEIIFKLNSESSGELNSSVELFYNEQLSKQDTFVQAIVEDVSDEKGNTIPLSDVNSFALADFNSDGLIDIAFAADKNSAVFVNQGAGKYELAASFLTNINVKHIAVADFNNDNFLDIAFATEDAKGSGVVFNDGNLSFVESEVISLIPSQWVFAFDINADSLQDIILLDDSETGISIIKQPFEANSLFSISERELAFEKQVSFNDLAFGDLNNDGLVDLILAKDNCPVEIWYQTATGKFETQQLELFNASKVKLFDLNADGLLEIVAITQQGLEILDLATQNLQLVSSVNYLAFDIAHLLGNEAPEFVLISNDGMVSIFELTSNGYKALPIVFETESGQSIAVKDVDLDGDLDLIITSSSGNNEIRFNQGNGLFGEQTTDLMLEQVFASNSLELGDSAEWELMVSNVGLAEGKNVQIIVQLSNVTVSMINSDSLTCGQIESSITCKLSDVLEPEGLASVILTVNFNSIGTAKIDALVINDRVDDNNSNDFVTTEVTVVAKPVVTKPEKKKSSGAFGWILLFSLLLVITRKYRKYHY